MRRAVLPLLAFVMTAAACSANSDAESTSTEGTPSSAPASSTSTTEPASFTPPPPISGTAQSEGTQPASGNRYILGAGRVPDAEPIDIELGGTPVWVVGIPGESARWLVALDDGRMLVIAGVSVSNTGVSIPAGSPPLVIMENGAPRIAIGPPRSEASALTAPVVRNGSLWWVGTDGRLAREETGARFTYDVDALADSRIAIGSTGLAAVLAQPTDRYPHGIAGDVVESEAVAIVDPDTGEITSFLVDDFSVTEGTAAMWVDADDDGVEEILVTLSDAAEGARLALFSRTGELLAEGPPIGQGNRWRHQIGAAPTGPNGETEIVVVKTPHIGGIAEFYRLVDGRLDIVASTGGVTSHVIFTRNMDMALLADADGDGAVELVAPTQDRESIAGVRRTGDGAEIAWTTPLGGTLSTNLAAAVGADGVLVLAAGTEQGTLRIWGP